MMRLPNLKRLSPQLLAAAAGAVLVLVGAGLGLAAAFSTDASAPPGQAAVESAAGGATAAAGSIDATAPPTGGSQPPMLGADTATTEPTWLRKQREAEAEQKQREAQTPEPGSPQERLSQIPGTGQLPLLGPVPTLPSGGPTIAGVGTRQVGTNGQTPLRGTWGGRPEELSSFLLASNQSPRFTVPALALAKIYVKYAAEVDLRADVLWAQMLHETGYGKYSGDVTSLQNNFAGIGATGGGAAGHQFPTAEAGAKAHIAHMVAYVYTTDPASWTNATVDPRYDAVNPRGAARVLADLNGRWAVPGTTYGQAIERLVARINR